MEVEVFGVADGVGEPDPRPCPAYAGWWSRSAGQAQVLVVQAEPGAEVTQAVLAGLDGARVGRVVTRSPTLEDAYIELVSAG